MDFWIYVVPFAMATIAKFCVLAAKWVFAL
jgi:hypothetical protein